MRTLGVGVLLMVGILGAASIASAEDRVRVRPIDVYVSGLGGYSFPFTADVEFLGQTIAREGKLDQSPSSVERWDLVYRSKKEIGGRHRR